MHYYQFNIADYQSHTRHLSLIEDVCYRRLLDWHYLHEKPLPLDIEKVARLLLLNECLADVEQVLNEFFNKTEDGWVNVRAIAEIQEYKEKIEKASIAGKASAAKRKDNIKQSFNDCSTDVQPNNNHKPLNNNHKPTTNKKPSCEIALVVDDNFNLFWKAYPKKSAPDAAKKSWNKLKPNITEVLNALQWQRQSEQWQKNGGQYIPNPATYLNQGRWKDEPPVEELW